jgi:hyperosmotically inducible protein
MTQMKYTTALLTILFCSIAGAASYAEDNTMAPVQSDNTQVNTRDRNAGEATADQQKENKADRDMAKEIRHSIMADKSLSSYAHNIKIIIQDGIVTLKGPVRSAHEKHVVIDKAVAVAGNADKITDQISIKHYK